MNPQLQASNRAEWRSWLSRNHADATEVWLVYFKKHTRKTSISYPESVEEAICFGWIDGLKKRIDDERYTHRFTPRRPGSKWSPRNIDIARKMIAMGKMTEAGRRTFDEREAYDEDLLKAREATEVRLPPEIEAALKSSARAWKNFKNLTPSHRKQYILWLCSAKRQETLERRLAEAIALLERNEKLGMR